MKLFFKKNRTQMDTDLKRMNTDFNQDNLCLSVFLSVLICVNLKIQIFEKK